VFLLEGRKGVWHVESEERRLKNEELRKWIV
jgi:hypothetical protein